MVAWRICKSRHQATALSGEGAAKFPGRWNSAGHRIIYLGESRSLAALETLVHVEDLTLLSAIAWIAIPVSFDESLVSIPKVLPSDWHVSPPATATRQFGDQWIDERRSVVLRVPSVVTKGEFNYLINPAHPDFRRIKVGTPESFRFDKRISRRQ
ncbi:MAG: RES domain-containing protein [Opitutaceae bacterium]|nr:RES domain-containing protein [Opitutaceae bacterium]